MATLTDAYITVEELHDHLYETPDAVKSEDRLIRAINAASRAVDAHCNRRFYTGAATARVYQPVDPYLLAVDDISSTSNLVVKTSSTDVVTYDSTWTIDVDFVVEPANRDVGSDTVPPIRAIRAVGSKTFPTAGRFPRAEITAEWGWAAVPDGVVHATLLIAARLFRRSVSPDGFVGVSDFGPARVSMRMDPDAVMELQQYRRHAVLVG